MPTTYKPPVYLRNGHLNTIMGGRLRRVPAPDYTRERIDTPDGDFLDIDWSYAGDKPGPRVVILSTGLEGSSDRTYVRGMTHALNGRGYDVAAWNYRGCSGEPNRVLRLYHSGSTDDLRTVIGHVHTLYDHIALIGFSLGGNLTLRHLGEVGEEAVIETAIAFSVPVDLKGSAEKLALKENRMYMRRFIKSLSLKMREKAERFPEHISVEGLEDIQSFREFDNRYTAPLHGFRDAEDYWEKCGSLRSLEHIRVPTLLVNAVDDPFLTPSCFPRKTGPYVRMEAPRYGGHIGFYRRSGLCWSEERALKYLDETWPDPTTST